MNESDWTRELFQKSDLVPNKTQPPFVRTMPPQHPETDEGGDYDQRRLACYEAALGPADVSLRATSGMPAIDVHRFPPTEARPYWVWITSGMSDFPQDTEQGPIRTELVTFSLRPEEQTARLLADLALFPFRSGTHLGVFHTLALPDGMLPPGFNGVPFLPPLHLQSIDGLSFAAAEPASLLHVLPVTGEELTRLRAQDDAAIRFGKALGPGTDTWLFDRVASGQPSN